MRPKAKADGREPGEYRLPLAGVIFDFDGVLADSEPVHLHVFQTVLDRIGLTLTGEEYYAQYLGYSDRDAFIHVLRDRGVAMSEAELEALIESKKELFPQAIGDHALYPGAAACVARVAEQVPVAIASGALRHEIELILDRSGLRDRFPIIVARFANCCRRPGHGSGVGRQTGAAQRLARRRAATSAAPIAARSWAYPRPARPFASSSWTSGVSTAASLSKTGCRRTRWA